MALSDTAVKLFKGNKTSFGVLFRAKRFWRKDLHLPGQDKSKYLRGFYKCMITRMWIDVLYIYLYFLRSANENRLKCPYLAEITYSQDNKKAGDGNRTHVSSLEGWCSTIELHPHDKYELIFLRNRGDRIRTCDFLVPNQAL